MKQLFFQVWNKHAESCGVPPAITVKLKDNYHGYFENRFGEQWVFVYDREKKTGELLGGDIGWETVVTVKEGQVDVMLGKAETAWLQACWKAATDAG